jgi:hypothetical protein
VFRTTTKHNMISQTAFAEQEAAAFIEAALPAYGVRDLADLPPLDEQPATALVPVSLRASDELSPEETRALVDGFRSAGVVAFSVPARGSDRHPLLGVGAALDGPLPLSHPLTHPTEDNPQAREVLGPPDGTTKIFDMGDDGRALSQAGQEELAGHFDGAGRGGAVVVFGLYVDSAPRTPAVNFFQDLVRVALELARSDAEAFTSLFYPTAMAQWRRSMWLTNPILFVSEAGEPQVFFRVRDPQDDVYLRADTPGLERARDHLETYSQAHAPGSTYVALDRAGLGVFVDNRRVVHGRTGYTNAVDTGERRVLARKWWVRGQADLGVQNYPGLKIRPSSAALFPEAFGAAVTEGLWHYDPETRRNVRVD